MKCKLSKVDYKNVNNCDNEFLNFKSIAKVYSIYDGDTCNLLFYYEPLKRFIKKRMRMAYYDTPEIQKGNNINLIEHKLAIDAKVEFENLVNLTQKKNSDFVWFKVIDIDKKWNRPVIMLWNLSLPHTSINAIIHKKHGIDYDGGKKTHIWGDDRGDNINTDYDYKINYD